MTRVMSSNVCICVCGQSLIPDLKPLQEAVVDLHPDEGRFSGDEDSAQQPERDEDQGLQIRRTVTQVHYQI